MMTGAGWYRARTVDRLLPRFLSGWPWRVVTNCDKSYSRRYRRMGAMCARPGLSHSGMKGRDEELVAKQQRQGCLSSWQDRKFAAGELLCYAGRATCGDAAQGASHKTSPQLRLGRERKRKCNGCGE